MSHGNGAVPGTDGAVVTGGRGFATHLDSLEAAAGELHDAAVAVRNAQGALYMARLSIAPAACTGSAMAAQYDDESNRLELRARRAVSEAEGIATAVRAAAAAYEEEEAKRAVAVDGLQNLLGGSGGVPLLLQLMGLPILAAFMGRARDSPGRSMASIIRGLASGQIEDSSGEDLAVSRAPVAAGSGDPGTFGYGLRSLRAAQSQVPLDDGSRVPESSILVERFVRADGSVAVLVSVPGTETWNLDDSNVMDTEGILDGLGRQDSQVRALIRHALADQGLGPADEVVFTCYSQGVIHVMGLLEDPEFLGKYRVSAVTAVGGPVAAFNPPAEIPILSLTNADDIVPAASGHIAEPLGSVVSVRTPARGGAAAAATFPLQTAAQAHDLENYERDGQLLDASENPAVAQHAGIVGAALGAGVLGSAALAAPPPQRERFAYTGTDLRSKTGHGTPAR